MQTLGAGKQDGGIETESSVGEIRVEVAGESELQASSSMYSSHNYMGSSYNAIRNQESNLMENQGTMNTVQEPLENVREQKIEVMQDLSAKKSILGQIGKQSRPETEMTFGDFAEPSIPTPTIPPTISNHQVLSYDQVIEQPDAEDKPEQYDIRSKSGFQDTRLANHKNHLLPVQPLDRAASLEKGANLDLMSHSVQLQVMNHQRSQEGTDDGGELLS